MMKEARKEKSTVGRTNRSDEASGHEVSLVTTVDV